MKFIEFYVTGNINFLLGSIWDINKLKDGSCQYMRTKVFSGDRVQFNLLTNLKFLGIWDQKEWNLSYQQTWSLHDRHCSLHRKSLIFGCKTIYFLSYRTFWSVICISLSIVQVQTLMALSSASQANSCNFFNRTTWNYNCFLAHAYWAYVASFCCI